MSAYIILKDRWSKTLTIPQAMSQLGRGKVFYSDTRVIGTFWAATWKEAKKLFDTYCGH